MHAVVRRRVEDPFERTELPDEPGVNPELIEGVERGAGGESDRRESEQGQGQVEHPGEEALEGALVERHREVVFLGLMVNRMGRPEGADLMTLPVEPVVTEIDAQETGGED